MADADLRRLEREDCEPVYSFRHVLDFTTEVEELETVLNSSRLSASPDHPEALLDGMLQAALCQVYMCVRVCTEGVNIVALLISLKINRIPQRNVSTVVKISCRFPLSYIIIRL